MFFVSVFVWELGCTACRVWVWFSNTKVRRFRELWSHYGIITQHQVQPMINELWAPPPPILFFEQCVLLIGLNGYWDLISQSGVHKVHAFTVRLQVIDLNISSPNSLPEVGIWLYIKKPSCQMTSDATAWWSLVLIWMGTQGHSKLGAGSVRCDLAVSFETASWYASWKYHSYLLLRIDAIWKRSSIYQNRG